MESKNLSDQLKSLGVKMGAREIPSSPGCGDHYPIEVVVKGYEHSSPSGSTFVVKTVYDMDYLHGEIRLCSHVNPEMICRWAKLPGLSSIDQKKIIYLDTETSGLAGGTGTFVFMIGLGFYTDNGFELVQLFMRDPAQEQALLQSLSCFLDSYNIIVTFNGKAFDIPILNTRHVLKRFVTPFTEKSQIDLLHLARRLWRNRLQSRAMIDLEREILKIPRTEGEVPGWLVPILYYDYLISGDARPLSGVFYHNAMDIVSLAALFAYISDLLENPLRSPDPNGLDLIAIGKLYEELGYLSGAVTLYEKSLDIGLPQEYFIQTLMRYALLQRKNGNWPEAIKLWEKAANYGNYDACIELAKYYEHRAKEYQQALYWVEKAQLLFSQLGIDKESYVVDLACRRKRLVSF